MLAAHMDEIGFMITGVDSEGALRFDVVGGVDDRQWIGKPVLDRPRARARRDQRSPHASAQQ